MSELGDRLEKWLTGRSGDPYTLRDWARDMVSRHGSGRGAARAIGVPESTLRGWAKGSQPRGARAERANSLIRESSSRKVQDGDFSMTVDYRKTRQGKSQTLTPRNLKWNPGAAERIRSAYVKGGKEAAALQLLKETNDRVYRRMLTPDSLKGALQKANQPASGGTSGAGSGSGGASGGGSGGGATGGVADDYDDDYYAEEYDLDDDYTFF